MARNNPTVTLTFAGDSKQVTKSAEEGADATTAFREKVEHNSTAMTRATQLSSVEQGRALGNQRQEYDKTADSFENMVNRMVRERRRIDTLNKNAASLGVKEHPVFGMVYKQPAHDAGDDAGDSFSTALKAKVAESMKSLFSGPVATVAVSAAIGLAGPVGLAAGGALVLGFGAAIAGLGMAVAAKSPEVLAHFERLKVNVQAKMMQISKPFQQTLIDAATAAQRVFNTIAPELDKVFPQAAKDVSEFIFNLQDAFRQLAPVIGPIMEAFGKILDSIGPQLPGVFQDIANALIPLAQNLSENSDGFATIVIFMLGLIPVAINLINAMIEFGEWWASVWNDIGQAVEDAWSWITDRFSDLSSAAQRTGDFISGVFGAMKDAVVLRLREMLSGVRDWPATVKATLGDLGHILWDAGSRLIGGLIDGIKARFSDVLDTLRGLTAKFPVWKGPADVDSKLLIESGQLIIGGLVTGLRSEEPTVRSYLDDLTRFIGGFGPDGSASVAAPARVAQAPTVRFGSDGSRMGDAVLSLVQEAIRARGGDPGVLGV